ncbi:Histidine kinase-, DNA gyrase B-, and HSP90-like ATPase [Burkholderia sp. GAS332]|nr:Histidine kinase-, DNA gyrase B-, and HSP90-like ATPase [Burkholderia sp. GAS332]
MLQELDLTPDPRVLQMLGEISLQPWRCIAELIDNGIDGFLSAARGQSQIANPEITVTVPTVDNDSVRVVVKDNGPGMSIDMLENAVKAGWTGKDSLSNLGLFGMGFNIATARLGVVTEVWTTRAGDLESVGVRIDLEALNRTRNFKVPRQTRPKQDPNLHGTEIVISRLKPDQRAFLARSNNLKTIRKQLARTYASLLTNSEAGRIRLLVNGTRIIPRLHCVWDEARSVELNDGTPVSAVERIDRTLAPRRYCAHCMRTLTIDDHTCPTGSASCSISETPRRLRGWIGIQRYLDKTEFGIDFIRNGRKIEIANKDLFVWTDGESSEVEYPIDDPRNRGRFVGEIHIDHCRVSYTKDRFERDDPAWDEMVRIVRGDGPLRPIAARQRGYDGNQSPLYKLFQAFRRSSPQGKNSLWSRVMVVRDNDRSMQMAESFANGDPDYLTDERWWQLVEEQDKEALGEHTSGSEKPSGAEIPDGFFGGSSAGEPARDTSATKDPQGEVAPETFQPTLRRQLHELTRKYVHPTYRVEYDVQAFAVSSNDKDLQQGVPWLVRLDDVATRTYGFLVDVDNPVFRSTTMTPLDALLTELSHRTVEFLKGQVQEVSIASILTEFRLQYCVDTRLDPQEIIAQASTVIGEIARSVPVRLKPGQGATLFDELSQDEREAIAGRMAARGVSDHKAIIADGRFLDYADPQSIRAFFNRYPNLFLDGKYWDDSFELIDFGSERITNQARERIRSRYDAYLGDAVWLAYQTPADLEDADRDAIIRATCSLRLLRPDVVE